MRPLTQMFTRLKRKEKLMRNLLGRGPSGSRLYLLAALAAAFLLVPAASAFAGTGNVNERKATVEIMGAGSGTIKSSPGPLEGNPPLECHWNGSEIDVGQTYTKVGGPSEANTKEVVAGECNTEAGEGAGFPGLKVEYIADAGSEFAYPPGWELVGANSLGGSCEPYIAFCAPASVAVIDFTIKATFGIRYPLTVKKTGSGDGTVKSKRSHNSVECAPGCTEATEEFAATTLTETPDGESEFTGWTGCSEEKEEAGKVNCIVSLSGAAEVEANFTEPTKFALNLATSGSGSGSFECDVGSGPEGCEAEYLEGTEVEVIPVADPDSEFIEWTGDCSGTDPEGCTLTMDEEHSVGAVFDEKTPFALNLATSGSGSGSFECDVGSGPEGCEAEYLDGTEVEVIPVADPDSEFIEWTGDCSGTDPEGCTLTMDEEHSVGAVFDEKTSFALNLATSGSGSGSFECDPGSGPEACEAEYLDGTEVEVIPVAGSGSEFIEWEGDCSGSGACEVTMDEEHSVVGKFDLIDRALTITEGGSGSGEVECEVEESEIEEACQPTYPDGTNVVVIGFEDVGSEFVEWTGDCDAVFANECELTMNADKTVGVTFDLITHDLTVNTAGAGSGSVSCDGGACAASYPENTTVTLTAAAAPGSAFAGWSGAGCSGAGSCVVTINADTTVTATFDIVTPPPPPPDGGDNGDSTPPAETCVTNAALCKPGLLIANPAAWVKGNKALLKVRCRGEQGARCRSTLKLIARIKIHGKKKNVLVGKSKYNLPTNSAVRVLRAKLTHGGLKLVRRAGQAGLTVKLVGKGAKNRVVKLKQQGGKGKSHHKRGGRR